MAASVEVGPSGPPEPDVRREPVREPAPAASRQFSHDSLSPLPERIPHTTAATAMRSRCWRPRASCWTVSCA